MEEQNPRLTNGSSAGREAPLVPGCSLVDCRFFVFANLSHPKDVREFYAHFLPGYVLHEKGYRDK